MPLSSRQHFQSSDRDFEKRDHALVVPCAHGMFRKFGASVRRGALVVPCAIGMLRKFGALKRDHALVVPCAIGMLKSTIDALALLNLSKMLA